MMHICTLPVLANFKSCKYKRTETRLRGLVCNFLYTNKERWKIVPYTLTLFFCSCTIRNGLLVIVFPWFSEYNISIWTSLHQKTNHNLRPQVDFTQLTEQVYANQFIFIKKGSKWQKTNEQTTRITDIRENVHLRTSVRSLFWTICSRTFLFSTRQRTNWCSPPKAL